MWGVGEQEEERESRILFFFLLSCYFLRQISIRGRLYALINFLLYNFPVFYILDVESKIFCF